MADAEYKRLGCQADGCDKDHKALGLCAMHYRRLQRHGSHNIEPKHCAHCGDVFSNVIHHTMYCGKACKLRAWRLANPDKVREPSKKRNPPPPLQYSRVNSGFCKQCAAPFVLRFASHGFCSQKCKAACAAQKAFASNVEKHKRRAVESRCTCCGCVFCPMYGASHAQMCSVCRSERKLQDKRTHRLARKMRQRTQTVEAVNPIRVFERDRWKCQLCKRATPRKLRGTLDDRAPELDHITPISKGGEHSYRNTQCACRACNLAKSDSPMGQMLLIG